MKSQKQSIFILTLAVLALFYLLPQTVFAQNIKQHQWKNRILIIKTNNPESKTYKKQILEFKNATKELAERKLILYHIAINRFELVDFSNNNLKKTGQTSPTFKKDYLNQDEDFEIRLIGLDGNTKLHRNKLLEKKELFKIIDVMPMRRAELNSN